MNYAIAPAAVTSLTVAGITGRFPVNRIFCVGRNYACLLYTSDAADE